MTTPTNRVSPIIHPMKTNRCMKIPCVYTYHHHHHHHHHHYREQKRNLTRHHKPLGKHESMIKAMEVAAKFMTFLFTSKTSKTLTFNSANNIIIFFALLLHYQGLKISKCRTVCPEWLWWGLRNCECVGKADCVETLNCHRNALVQERSFPRIGCAERGSSADFCDEAVGLVW